jgi:hypothetical protein
MSNQEQSRSRESIRYSNYVMVPVQTPKETLNKNQRQLSGMSVSKTNASENQAFSSLS